MVTHALRRGACRAWVLGRTEQPQATVIQLASFPDEPVAFGADPWNLLAVLRHAGQWTAVNVPVFLGAKLAAALQRLTGKACTLTEEIYSVLLQPAPDLGASPFRLLTPDDLPMMEAATGVLGMGDWRFGSAGALVREGIVAGAIVGNQLAAVAFTAGIGDRYADIGVVTHQDWRGRGLATACAAIVCREIQARGLTPVWGTSVENLASRRVADKLGFEEVSRRVYVSIVE
jgi:GNAT superfamily N-acetyltransferase